MTYLLILITAVVSIVCFYKRGLFEKLAFEPYMVWHRKQWYRLITHGFVHADYMHLFVNMLVLWSFGIAVESIFKVQQAAGNTVSGTMSFLLLYFGGMIAASLYDLFKRRDNFNYVSVGASGAVSAVIFCSIFFGPMNKIYFFGAIPIPGIIFGGLYLWYEYYMGKRQNDHVNHYAHILGAVYGFIFPLFMEPSLIKLFLNGF